MIEEVEVYHANNRILEAYRGESKKLKSQTRSSYPLKT